MLDRMRFGSRGARRGALSASVAISAVICGCGASADSRLLGRWKSDEARTLAEMRTEAAAGTLSNWNASRTEHFSNDFFGRLHVEYESGRSRSWFVDEDVRTAEWGAHRVQDLGDGRLLISDSDTDTAAGAGRVLHVEADGRCYAIEIVDLGFREWFCRID